MFSVRGDMVDECFGVAKTQRVGNGHNKAVQSAANVHVNKRYGVGFVGQWRVN